MSKIFLRIGENAGILLLVNIIGAVIGFLMAAALGRGLGDTGFGQYSFVMTWLLGLTLLTEFGLSTVLTRDLAARLEETNSYLINSLLSKSLLSLPAVLIIVFLAPRISPQQKPELIAALRWGLIFLYSGLFYSSFTAIFKAHQIMLPILWLTLGGQIVLLLGTVFLLLAQQPLSAIIAWGGISQSLQALLALVLYRKVFGHSEWMGRIPAVRRDVNRSRIRSLLLTAWPFALAGLLATLQFRANILILAYLQGDQSVGWYAAANRFVETGKQLPGAFYAAVLPALAALAADSSQSRNLQKTFFQAQLTLLAFSLLAALGAIFLARFALILTYGTAYQPATLTLQILTLALIPATQNSLLIVYLYAHDDEKFVNWLMAGGIVINLGLCFWLIPIWGAAGTALALLIAETVLYWPYKHRAARLQERMPVPVGQQRE